jgi:hypothetical protein
VAAEKVYVTRNREDSTLERWPEISYRCKKAIGVTGIDANCLGEHSHKLCQQTLTSDVGDSHYIEPHLESPRFMSTLCCFAFPGCAEAISSGAAPSGGGGNRPSTSPSLIERGIIEPLEGLRDALPLPGRGWQRGGIFN